MFDVLERLITTVFGAAGKNFLDSVARGTDTIYDFVYVRVIGLPFVVLGARGTGKTTLLEWLRQNVSVLEDFDPAPTAPGGDDVPTFSAFIGDETMRLRPTRDVGGESSMWEIDWVTLLREAKPRGIIFLIDHEDIVRHKDALHFVMNLIEEEPALRGTLKAFLLMVNKSDLWLPTTSLEALMATYATEIKRLRNQADRLGYQTSIQSSSIANGVGMRDGVRWFFNTLRPQPKTA